MRKTISFLGTLLLLSWLCNSAVGTEIDVPAFKEWTLEGTGQAVGDDVLEITGEGPGNGQWVSPPLKLRPGHCYRFGVSIRGLGETRGGCLPCGLVGFSRDYNAASDDWTEESFSFRLPEPFGELPLRVGQWESKGTFQFRDVKLETVVPARKECRVVLGGQAGTLLLGEGESISGGTYRFQSRLNGRETNIDRTLLGSNTSFNTYRWVLNEGSEVVYCFDLPVAIDGSAEPKAISFDAATLRFGVCYFAEGSGEGVVEISRDGLTRWTTLGRITAQGANVYPLPQIAFPLERIFVRFRGLQGSHFQINRVDFEGTLLENGMPELKTLGVAGETLIAAFEGAEPKEPDELSLTADGQLRVRERVDGGESREQLFPLRFSPSPEETEQRFELGDRTYTLTLQTHPLHRSDYGYPLAASGGARVWWCEADWKVSRDRPTPPSGTTQPIEIAAAGNDVEAFQLVVRGEHKPIRGLSGTVSELTGPGGAKIPADRVELLYAYYHFVHSKTDETGVVDFWPDALPPLEKPIDVAMGQNQPIWVRVNVPAGTVPGVYRGSCSLHSVDGSFNVEVPFAVRVWGFSLPKENHLETAFGFAPWRAFEYHNAKTEDDRRRVLEMYLQCFADHRISIYNPTPLDGFGVKWLPDETNGEQSRCEIDFGRYDAEMSRVLDKFRFTNFTVPGYGLGSGTFHSRTPPNLAGYGEETPQYKAMIADYYAKLQQHLKDKGWLDKSYVYWFDEPGPHDFDFVAAGTAKLEKYGPEIPRMMTLMMSDDRFMKALDAAGTTINIWCTISNHFQDELAKQRRAKGERFWWYVCTGPKAPYCTLFLDHPATELRVWHWQAWEREIVGTLVWESVYWTSGTAFPDGFQNPYEDPMSYTSGYSVPKGEKRNWGNGDGRFIYPPLSAAVPGLNEGKPNFEKPVSSIRWEMIRDGVEDYEMLFLLRELLQTKGNTLSAADRERAAELLVVPDSISRSLTEFTIDPRPLLQRRAAVGGMIEKLSGGEAGALAK